MPMRTYTRLFCLLVSTGYLVVFFCEQSGKKSLQLVGSTSAAAVALDQRHGRGGTIRTMHYRYYKYYTPFSFRAA